jgi:hypothetical protein
MPQELGDAVDASLEMPEQYGSRGLWRYYQVSGLIGLVALPLLVIMSFFEGPELGDRIVRIFGWVTIAASAIFFIRRDINVQRRIDATGSPLAKREPF